MTVIELSSAPYTQPHQQIPRSAVFARVAGLVVACRNWLRYHGPALLLFVLLALLVMAPVISQSRSRVIGWSGDNIQYVYITGWMAQAVLLGHSPFVDPRANYPDELNLMATDVPYAFILAVAPTVWLAGPVFGYNLLIWLNLILSGFFAYLWICQITGNRVAGVVAGMIFLLTPYRIVHAYGHLQLVTTFALPLFFWTLDTALRPPVPRWRDLVLLAGAVFLVGSSAQYYLVICLLTGAAYAFLSWFPHIGRLLRYGWLVLLAVSFGAVLSALPYLTNLGGEGYTSYNVLDTRIWSAGPLNFVLPSRLHPLWGAAVEQLRPEPLWIEKTLYIGAVAAMLALVGLFWRSSGAPARLPWVWLGTALAAGVLALGTDLHVNGQPLQTEHPFWLPGYYLAQLPIVSLMRVWARFGIVTILFVALLAGLGASLLYVRFAHRRWLLPVLLVGLLLLDLLPGDMTTTNLEPRPVDRWLAQQSDTVAIAHLPAGDDVTNYRALYGSLFHGHHLTAYGHPSHLPEAYRDFVQQATDFPAPDAVQALHAMGFRYLLLERAMFDGQGRPTWEETATALSQSSELVVVAEWEDVVVVEFR